MMAIHGPFESFVDSCKKGNTQLAINALSQISKLNTPDRNGKAAIHYAVEKGDYDIVKYLLENGANVNLPTNDMYKFTPLHLAVRNGNKILVEWLLAFRADPTLRAIYGRSAFEFAASGDHAEILRLLADHVVDIDHGDDWGNTPLHSACRVGAENSVKTLLELGSDPDAKNKNQETPLSVAEFYKFGGVVDLLNQFKEAKCASSQSTRPRCR